jgi:hypothetical protein
MKRRNLGVKFAKTNNPAQLTNNTRPIIYFNNMRNMLTKVYYKLPDLRVGDYIIITTYFGFTVGLLIFLKNFTRDAYRTAAGPLTYQFWNNRVI